jgi:hypothetical protein
MLTGFMASMVWGQDAVLVWDAAKKTCEPSSADTPAKLSYAVTNVSTQPVVIQGLRTSCGCTTGIAGGRVAGEGLVSMDGVVEE